MEKWALRNSRKRILSVIIFLLPIYCFGQLDAEFTANKLKGCVPLVVQFSDLSSGSPTGFSWNFGNGNSSTEKNPSAVYINPGIYTVTLTVTDGVTNNTETKNAYITVFSNPVATFSGGPLRTGCVPLPVDFVNSSVAGPSPSAPLNSHLWSFGDGNSSSQINPTHSFNASGSFTVTLQVTDTNGCKNTMFINNYIVATKPTAAFTATPLFSCTAPLDVAFSNTSTGTGITHQWDFGDGNISSATSPTNTFAALGNYSPQLIVTDANNCKDTLKRTNYVNMQNIVANFTVNNPSVCIGSSVTFSDLTIGSTNWLWNFGDGTTSTAKNPVKTYASPGVYDVTLTAGSASCSAQEIKTGFVTIHPKPLVDFSSNITLSCFVPLSVTFTNSTVGGSTYLWNYGNTVTSTDDNASHDYTYNSSGTYTVKLYATSAFGCLDSLVRPNYITTNRPNASFSTTPSAGCLPLPVSFNGISSTANEAIISWSWNFGDGNTSTTAVSAAHTYLIEGVYSASLTITTISGCTHTFFRTVMAGNKPSAGFSFNPTTACGGELVQFDDNSTGMTGAIPQWLWDMEVTSGSGNPAMVAFLDTGLFDVRLIALNNGCADTLIYPDTIRILGPVSRFSHTQVCKFDGDPFTLTYRDTSLAPETWLWDFGDGSPTSSDQHPVHTFSSSGFFNVSLTVTNSLTGCTHTSFELDTITNPIAAFTTSDTAGCYPFMPIITNTSSDAKSYQWTVGADTSSKANPSFTFKNPGFYDVLLIIDDIRGCYDTLRLDSFYLSLGFITNFKADTLAGCAPFAVQFGDSTLSDSTLVRWKWDFGDGTIDSIQHPSHTYLNGGSYSVQLINTDTNGCIDTLRRVNYILPTFPVPVFTTTTPETCKNRNVVIKNSSTGSGLIYAWDFGDNTTSTLSSANINKSYPDGGVYDVKLILTDKNGCQDSILKTSFITVQDPFADFTPSATSHSCPPFPVTFTNLSTNLGSGNPTFVWNFGDGSSNSTLVDPLQFFNIPGTFSVRLTATTAIGCVDDTLALDLVSLAGPAGTFSADTVVGCRPFPVVFTSTAVNTATYIWDYGDGVVDMIPSDSVANHLYTNGGVFNPTLIMDDGLGCQVEVPSPFGVITVNYTQYTFESDTNTICNGGSIALSANSIVPSTNFTWSPNIAISCTACSAPVINPIQTTTYYLSVTSNGCPDQDSIVVTVHQLPVITTLEDPAICSGTTTQLEVNSLGATSYNWSPSNDLSCNNCNDPVASPLVTTSYTVAVSDDFCKDSILVTVNVNNTVEADFTPSTLTGIIPLPVTFNNQTLFADTYTWDFGNGKSSSDVHPSITYKDTGTFIVTLFGTNLAGCSDSVKMEIIVGVISSLNPPNIFTPNGDGKNDLFTLNFTSAGISEFEGKIFNRWGQMIATWDHVSIGWNGRTSSNELVPDGTYFYLVNARGMDNTPFEFRGAVTLMR